MKINLEAENEKAMYTICFSTLAICLISLLLLSGISPFPLFRGSITGAAVLENISLQITKEMALDAILEAENDMEEMQEDGFNIAWVNDTLIEAKKYFEGENYTDLLRDLIRIQDLEKREKARDLITEAQDKIGTSVDYGKVLEKTKAISERKVKAYEISDYIGVSELRISEIEETGQKISDITERSFVGRAFGLGAKDTGEPTIDTTPIHELLSKAETEFKEERYENAIELLSSIEPKIDEMQSENTLLKTIYRAGKETTLNFIKEHYIALIVTLIIIIILFLLSYNRIMVQILNRRIKEMEVEEEVLTELMKKAQRDYYSTKTIPKTTYTIKLSKYKESMQTIKQQLPVVQARLDKLAKMRRIV